MTDVTNASRTLLCSLATLDWDDELLALFGVDRALLPRIVALAPSTSATASCSARAFRSAASPATSRRRSTARAATRPGEAKATYGTGSFVLVHTGDDASRAAARPPEDGGRRRLRARRARCSSAAPRVQWLRDGLGLLGDAAESEALARSVDVDRAASSSCPALTGLGSPWWDAGRARARSPGSRAARRARTSSGRRSRRSRTRSPTSSMRCRERAGAAARRRRRGGERLPDAVPGRPARAARRGRGRARDDGARSGGPRRRPGRPGRRRRRLRAANRRATRPPSCAWRAGWRRAQPNANLTRTS